MDIDASGWAIAALAFAVGFGWHLGRLCADEVGRLLDDLWARLPWRKKARPAEERNAG